MNERNRLMLRYHQISNSHRIDPRIDVALLKRNLRIKHHLEHDGIADHLAALEKFKASTARIDQKVRQVSKSAQEHVKVQTKESHHRIWKAEKSRLAKLETNLEDHAKRMMVAILSHSAMSKPGECVDMIQSVESNHESVVDSQMQAQELIAWKNQIRNADAKGIENFKGKLSNLQSNLGDLIEKDASDVESIERKLKSMTKSLAIHETIDRNPWIQFNNDILPLSDLECIDETLTLQKNHDLARLCEWYDESLAKMTESHQVHENVKELNHFHKLHEEYHSNNGSGLLTNARALFLNRVRLELGNKSLQEIETLEKVLVKKDAQRMQKAALTQTFTRKMQEFLQQTLKQFEEANDFYAHLTELEEKREKSLEKIEARHSLLKQWREARLVSLAILAEQRSRQLESELAKELEKQQRDQKRHDSDREKLDAFMALKSKESEEEVQRLAKLNENLKIEAEGQSIKNKQRVRFRETERKAKERQVEEAHAVKLELARLAEERLEKLRKTVAITAKSDPERLFKDTIAIEERRKATLEQEVGVLFPSFGFTTENVMKDVRFKLAAEFHRNGLTGSDYAKQVLQSLVPALPNRPDQVSSFTFI